MGIIDKINMFSKLVKVIAVMGVVMAEPLDKITQKTFLEVQIDGQNAGKITIGLFGNTVPKTVENFAALCTGDRGNGLAGKPLSYKDTPLHRIIPGFMAQGGDITSGDGTGGESIFAQQFDDENFKLKHEKPYLLSMANLVQIPMDRNSSLPSRRPHGSMDTTSSSVRFSTASILSSNLNKSALQMAPQPSPPSSPTPVLFSEFTQMCTYH